MFGLLRYSFLFALPFLAACGKDNSFATLQQNEKILFGRIIYAEKIYEAGDLGKEKPDFLSQLGSIAAGDSVRGTLSFCFEVEYRDKCTYLNTSDLDPRDLAEREKNRFMKGRNIFALKVAGNSAKLTQVQVGKYFYTVKDAKPIDITNGKIFYVGDILVTLHKTDIPNFFKLNLTSLNHLNAATEALAKKMAIPQGERVDARVMHLEGASVETSISVYEKQ